MIIYSHELDHIIATTSFMSRDLDNLQATKLRVFTLVVLSAGGRKQKQILMIKKKAPNFSQSNYGLIHVLTSEALQQLERTKKIKVCSINIHEILKYTANVLTIKTTGTGNCRGPVGKICTIYGKGL